eukprot:1578689-Amphidinium_carterae.1
MEQRDIKDKSKIAGFCSTRDLAPITEVANILRRPLVDLAPALCAAAAPGARLGLTGLKTALADEAAIRAAYEPMFEDFKTTALDGGCRVLTNTRFKHRLFFKNGPGSSFVKGLRSILRLLVLRPLLHMQLGVEYPMRASLSSKSLKGLHAFRQNVVHIESPTLLKDWFCWIAVIALYELFPALD